MAGDPVRLRIVMMGDKMVGKSSILKRFLFDTFQEKYRGTVEDLYSRDYIFGETTLKIDFLDTAGDDEFPVMRRLSISSAHAFLLVYSVTTAQSLELLHHRINEIKEQRNDFKDVPIVLVGNKVDLANTERVIFVEDVCDWITTDYPNIRAKVLECSAKDSYNISTVFKSFLHLSKIPLVINSISSSMAPELRLRRGTSAYANIRANRTNPGAGQADRRLPTTGSSKFMTFSPKLSLKFPSSPRLCSKKKTSPPSFDSEKTSPLLSPSSKNRNFTESIASPSPVQTFTPSPLSCPTPNGVPTPSSSLGYSSFIPPSSPSRCSIPPSNASTPLSSSYKASSPVFDFTTNKSWNTSVGDTPKVSPVTSGVDYQFYHESEELRNPIISKAKAKPRSRSLIRRSSKKVKQKINEAQRVEDCIVS